jgi:phosphoribosylaminoimidazolecarboxamide formyltransferase/IMP cyclohydrolase
MQKQIKSALISVFYKDGLDSIAKTLNELNVVIYSTGGTQQYLESLNIPCIAVEDVTGYPSILNGRVKTLHPSMFGGILGRRNVESDIHEMKEFKIPEIDLVIVDLYPFEETVKNTTEENLIIEKIDIGGPSMIRAAAKNFQDVMVLSSKNDYEEFNSLISKQKGATTIDQRKSFAAKAFEVVMHYDIAIHQYFSNFNQKVLRYGENPHQKAVFQGNVNEVLNQLHGKEISYNNLVDIDAAIQLINEFSATTFAILKHTNVCGIASRNSVIESWTAALEGDKESAFGAVLICNKEIDDITANAIHEIFFEVLIAPSFSNKAFEILSSKKNRILLELNSNTKFPLQISKTILNGNLVQDTDEGNFIEWNECGGRISNEIEKEDLVFANIICKHLKSNAIALVKNKQLIGKGCGQTSRIDALRHAIEKANQFSFNLNNAVLASDAFLPFNDCVQIAYEHGICAFIQPGGSIRDNDSIDYCKQHNLAMVLTGMRHFKH